MNLLDAFGFVAVVLMLITYMLEAKSYWFKLAFAGSCLLGAIYGFLQGAWPFGLVEVVWAGAALYNWFKDFMDEIIAE